MSGAAQPRAGRLFEYMVRDDLIACGWWVMRSPASKSPVDMVAIRSVRHDLAVCRVLFVQAKRDGRLDPAEWNVLYELARRHGAIPVMAKRALVRHVAVDYVELLGLKDRRGRQPMQSLSVKVTRG